MFMQIMSADLLLEECRILREIMITAPKVAWEANQKYHNLTFHQVGLQPPLHTIALLVLPILIVAFQCLNLAYKAHRLTMMLLPQVDQCPVELLTLIDQTLTHQDLRGLSMELVEVTLKGFQPQ